MSFVFTCDSDLHFQSDGTNILPRTKKQNNVKIINRIKPDFTIVAGDLTNNGSDGSKILCIPISGPQEQLQNYVSQYAKPLEENNIPIFASMGNHDNWTYPPYIYMAIQKYIIKKYGNTVYNFIHKNVQFICLGIVPDSNALKYFHSIANKSLPIVLFFHYNLVGAFSDWWSDAQKIAFNDAINGYQIKLIVTGHLHECAAYFWNNYQVITCGGLGLYQCSYSDITQSVTVEWVTS